MVLRGDIDQKARRSIQNFGVKRLRARGDQLRLILYVWAFPGGHLDPRNDEHRAENCLSRREPGGSTWEYQDAGFGDPERVIEFDPNDLVEG